MKKKLLVFIGLITFVMCFFLTVPKTKAQTNTKLVVKSYSVSAGTITFYDYQTQEFFGTFNFTNVWDTLYVLPFISNKEHIPYLFRIGDVYELIDQPSSDVIMVEFVRPADRQISYSLLDMVENQVYEYKGIVDGMYVFQQGFNFYQVPTTEGILFRNEISGLLDFTTTLKPGNYYTWVAALNAFYLSARTPDYIYYKGYETGRAETSESASNAYRDGYEAGSRYAEGLLESEYQRGLQNGYASGYDDGLNKGYQDGFNDAYDEIIASDEYTLGYENGFKDGEKSRIAQNNQSFYSGIEKWLVPAVIVVIVAGGIMSISVLKRREV